MSDAFFLPIGRDVIITTINKDPIIGVFKGIINFGGIPAIWLQISLTPDTHVYHLCLMQNVVDVKILKIESSKIFLDGGTK